MLCILVNATFYKFILNDSGELKGENNHVHCLGLLFPACTWLN